MGATFDDDRTDEIRVNRRRWTTIVLEQESEGEWRATQDGVPVEGRGETAAQAAADYCRRVEEGADD